ncbi:CLOCK-interacting pacemaker [Alosa sapidissima]|uniref:CLOCK-interacting pacemaker n=1 Tax=Alosa sapidissima TaxID=34773 RepID=UPI001C088666|nr:CLOCK-interacting pacemaker [Alosa sapidissima]
MSTKRKEESLPQTMGKSRTKRPDQSRPEFERDSGFSDTSSEHFSVMDQAESDDNSRKGGAGKGASRPSSQHSQLAVIGGFSPNLSPMIIMNNVLLKQPGDNPPTLKPWSFSPAVEMVQQPQMVFLQPVVSTRGPSVTTEPSSKRRRHKKYLPILKSYPKIAPHPGDSPSHTSTSSSSSSTSSSSSYSSVASSGKSCSLTFSHHERHRRDRKDSVSGYSTASSLPASPLPHIVLADSAPPAHISAPGGPAHLSRSASVPAANRKSTDTKTSEISRLQTPTESGGSSSRSSIRSNHSRPSSPGASSINQDGNSDSTDGDSNGSNKRKRFCNTYNILSKSGLLDITLRTKELIRQNRRTQGDLERLREHTSLFMEVLKSGDVSVYDRLQSSMLEEDNQEKSA